MTVRPWQPGDEGGIVDVVRAVYDEYGFIWDEHGYHADLYDIAGHFSAPNQLWVAENDGQIVGTAGIELFSPLPPSATGLTNVDGSPRVAGADCEIVRLYVIEPARGKGIGRALFTTVTGYARERGCKRMEIWSDVLFAEAHALYESFGAKVVGSRKCDYPEPYEEYGLVLDF